MYQTHANPTMRVRCSLGDATDRKAMPLFSAEQTNGLINGDLNQCNSCHTQRGQLSIKRE
jgi:hypothetical protein